MSKTEIAIELSLLGGFRARLAAGESLQLPTRKSRGLLAYLAMKPDRPHARETLAALLWGESTETKAHNSLSQAVTALRKALAATSPAPLTIDAASLTFHSTTAEVDALSFERLAAGSSAEELERAQASYQGELLAGIGIREPAFEEWVDLERARLHALATEASRRLLALLAASGEHLRAVDAANRLLVLDPLDESAHRALMRAYAAQGQLGLAVREYRSCVQMLRRELDVEPAAETTRLHEEILHRQLGTTPRTGSPRAEAVALDDTVQTVPDDEPPAVTPTLAKAARAPGPRWLAHGAVMLLASAALAATAWFATRDPVPSHDTVADRPSLVVLPFENLSGDPAEEYFTDGMADDLITDLAKISGIFVIARDSAFAFRERPMSPEDIAKELGVRYVLAGSMRRERDRVRINVRLIDTTSGGHVWAERFDGTSEEVFDLQDRIAARIVDALALELLPGETLALERRETTEVEAHDAYLLGLAAYYRHTPEDNARAAEHFERAIAIDRGYSAAYTALAKVYARAMVGRQAYADALGIFWSEGYTRARQLLEHAMAESNADFHVLRSWLALGKHQNHHAIAEAERAHSLNPNDADALEALAEALIFAGRADEGVAFARRAMLRNPTLLGRPLYLLGLAAFADGDARAAVQHIERAIAHAPARRAEFSGLLAAALGELGERERGRDAFRDFSAGFLNRPDRAWSVRTLSFTNPRFHTWRRIDLAWSVYSFPFVSAEVLERLAAGLEAAGAPASVGGYLPLHERNRLSGERIRAVLFGNTIEGTDFWLSQHGWEERRDHDGSVEHRGYPIHPGLPTTASGKGWIEQNRLCERWPALSMSFDVCIAIFRVPDQAARRRWGEYVMVTDTGPHPFSPAPAFEEAPQDDKGSANDSPAAVRNRISTQREEDHRRNHDQRDAEIDDIEQPVAHTSPAQS